MTAEDLTHGRRLPEGANRLSVPCAATSRIAGPAGNRARSMSAKLTASLPAANGTAVRDQQLGPFPDIAVLSPGHSYVPDFPRPVPL